MVLTIKTAVEFDALRNALAAFVENTFHEINGRDDEPCEKEQQALDAAQGLLDTLNLAVINTTEVPVR